MRNFTAVRSDYVDELKTHLKLAQFDQSIVDAAISQ